MTLTDRTAILFPTSVGAHSVSWLASLLLHATVAFGAFIFTQQIKLAPQPTPFTWDVAMVTTAPQATTNPSGVSSPTVPPATPSASTPWQRKSSPARTPSQPSTMAAPVHPVRPVLPHSPAMEQDTSVARPDAPIPAPTTPKGALESVAQERHEPEREYPLTTHEPTSLDTPPPQVSHQSPVTEPTASTTSSASVKTESTSEQQMIAMAPVPSSLSARPDYSWLSETILRRVEELKRYPAEARLDRAEGKVVLKAVIRGDGSVDDVVVHQSSGYRSLDHAAVELLKRAAPFRLPRPLGKSQMMVKIPMNYRLEQ
jgi:periplasmic protein TonB